MAHINLLPWREERRKDQQKQLLSITALSAFLMVAIVFAIHMQYSRQISTQHARNSYLQGKIGEVNKQLTEIRNLEKAKKGLLERMKIIQRLQQNRPEVVHLFDELARRIPEGVHLTSFKQTNKNLTIEGIAQSNARVSAFMRNIAASDWLSNPVLDVIKADGKSSDNARSFTLRATQVATSDQADNDKKRSRK